MLLWQRPHRLSSARQFSPELLELSCLKATFLLWWLDWVDWKMLKTKLSSARNCGYPQCIWLMRLSSVLRLGPGSDTSKQHINHGTHTALSIHRLQRDTIEKGHVQCRRKKVYTWISSCGSHQDNDLWGTVLQPFPNFYRFTQINRKTSLKRYHSMVLSLLIGFHDCLSCRDIPSWFWGRGGGSEKWGLQLFFVGVQKRSTMLIFPQSKVLMLGFLQLSRTETIIIHHTLIWKGIL